MNIRWWTRALLGGALLGAAVTTATGGQFPGYATVPLACAGTVAGAWLSLWVSRHVRAVPAALPWWSPWRYLYRPGAQRHCPHPPHRQASSYPLASPYSVTVRCLDCGRYFAPLEMC